MSIMQSKLNLLLSGIGLIGQKHANLIVQSQHSHLAAVVAPPSDHNLEALAKFSVPRFDSFDQAFKQLDIDGVIIASPNQFHFEQAVLCIQHKIPCLVEKPLTADLQSAEKICKLAALSGVPVLVGHHRTHSPLLPLAREILNSPQFGRLVSIQGAALFRKPEHYFDDGPWRKYIGGGPILINLIHEIGIMQYLCGPIESVWAVASNSNRGFEVEDTVAIGFEFSNGALGTFLLSDVAASNRSWEMTSGENPAYPYHSEVDCYHFAGANGSLDFPTLKFRFYGDDVVPSWWNEFSTKQAQHEPADPLAVQLAHFEDVIRGRASPIVPAVAGFENMRVLEAVNVAIRSGAKVDVSSILL